MSTYTWIHVAYGNVVSSSNVNENELKWCKRIITLSNDICLFDADFFYYCWQTTRLVFSFIRSFVCWAVVDRKEEIKYRVFNRLGSVNQRFILIISIDPPDAVYWRNHSSIGSRSSNSWARLYLSSSPGRGIRIQTLHQSYHCCTVICKRGKRKKEM